MISSASIEYEKGLIISRYRQRLPRIFIAILLFLSAYPTASLARQTLSSGEEDLSTLNNSIALFLDGDLQEWPFRSMNKFAGLSDSLLTQLHRKGYLFASLESESVGKESEQLQLKFVSGKRVSIGDIRLKGLTIFPRDEVLTWFNTESGNLFDQNVLGDDFDELLRRLDLAGRVLAKVILEDASLKRQGEDWIVDLSIKIDEGRSLDLADIEIIGGSRTRPSYIAKVLGYKFDKPIESFSPGEIERRLMETKAFRTVDNVGLSIDENEEAILKIKAVEEPPGVFDVILGYLPPASGSGSGSIVGNVNVQLLHVLGAGRAFGFKMDRLPGSVSRLDVEASDPYLAGTPVRLAVGFKGFQQDSTYSTTKYRLETGYRLVSGVESFVSLSREISSPSPIVQSDVQNAKTLFLGIGFSFNRLDFPLAPRSGFELMSNIEQGRKVRSLNRPSDSGGVEFFDDVVRQTRLTLYSRYYRPFRRRHVLALGLEGQALQSREYDQSDLFRLGGANSLRGYSEEQYRGNISARLLTEWRYLLERTSYFFVFSDLGFVSIPETGAVPDESEVTQEILPGYGFGMVFGTAAGLFSVSLALNPDEGLGSKVHLGISLGL